MNQESLDSVHSPVDVISTEIDARLRAGLKQLWLAFNYAHHAQASVWELAVSMSELRSHGLNATDMRWMILCGIAESGCETTIRGSSQRTFQANGHAALNDEACFVLTPQGATIVAEALQSPASMLQVSDSPAAARQLPTVARPASRETLEPAVVTVRPHWDPRLRELRVGDQTVKRFRVPAPNQELILTVFEEEGWPPRIDDPLPAKPEMSPKRRLRDAVNSLNRNQKNRLLRFSGNGNGNGVAWALIETAT